METTVATLLLVTASVVLACVVVNYAINIAQTTMNANELPAVAHLKEYVYQIQNETDSMLDGNVTQPNPNPSP